MLECHLSDICKSLSEHKSVTHQAYALVPTINNVLHDCMALCNITLEFYMQVESVLNLICKIFENNCQWLIKDLVYLLAKICEMIAKGKHFSAGVSVPVRQVFGNNIEECLVQLNIRVNRVTPRVVNIWKNILNGVKELEVVCYGFLRFFADIDPIIQRPRIEDPVVAMIKYARNPGHIVQVVRKIKSCLDSELVSLRTVREVKSLILKTPPEVITCVDKTLTGFIMWDLVRVALEYYRAYGLFHYKVDIFDKDLVVEKDCEKSLSRSLKVFSRHSKNEIRSVFKVGQKFARNNTTDFSKVIKFVNTEKIVQNNNPKNYENFINTKFQEFLLQKLKNSKGKSIKKSEILDEFNLIIAKLDSLTVSKHWELENILTTALNL